MTTFNAAAGDKDYCMEVDSKRFIEEHGKEEDLLLLQEAGTMRGDKDPPKGNILTIAKANGMEIIEGGQGDSGKYWVYIAYNPDRLEPQGERVDQQIHKDRKKPPDGTKVFGTGWGMAQRFRDKLTGLTVNVVNVHTGHNYSEDSMRRAKADIEKLQNSLGAGGDVTITGGDFNELGGGYKKLGVPGVLDSGTIGEGCTSQTTHHNGATDKIGAQGKQVLDAASEVLDKFGSDHNAVQLRVTLNV